MIYSKRNDGNESWYEYDCDGKQIHAKGGSGLRYGMTMTI